MSHPQLRRIEVFGVQVDAATLAETVEHIDRRIGARVFTQHGVVNVAKLVYMQDDEELRASVGACDIVNIDGMGVVWGARFLGERVPERVAGIDLFWALLELAAERRYPIFMLGAEQAVVERAVAAVSARFDGLQVADFHHGYFDGDELPLVERIQTSGARLLFVAMSSPKKENFINRWRGELGVDFVMGVGGTFDVVARKVSRAPVWMQRSGMEWLHRLLQEPRRMWRRYLLTNTTFAKMLLLEKLGFARTSTRSVARE